MKLSHMQYSEFEGTPQEWYLEGISFGESNLIVGKNATGKSRVLNIIKSLAEHLGGTKPIALSSNYTARFQDDNKNLVYHLKFEEGHVLEETVSLDDRILLDRGESGEGTIWAEDIDGGKEIRFKVANEEPAALAKRDIIQHKFLESLRNWGESLRHYYFGTPLGKGHMAVSSEKRGKKVDERDPNAVVALFQKAEKELKDEFVRMVIQDMRQLGYSINEIGVKPPFSIRFESEMQGEIVGLYVQEKDLRGITDQHSMSQGMFRALSILIQLNYSHLTRRPACILIDDIGEGLDFERSCGLIDVLRTRTRESNIQLILSTNDRFVMNRVPLEEWSVLVRQNSRVRVLNCENSRELFEEFKFTGLSNFSFLEMGFASGIVPDEAKIHE